MILRLSYPNRVGMLARITAAIARAKGDFRSVEMVESDGAQMVRDFTLAVGRESPQRAIVQALKRVSGVTIVQISNRTLQLPRGGKIEVQNKFPLDNGEVLAMASGESPMQSKKPRFKLASPGASSHRAGTPESRSGRVWRLAFSKRRWIFG
jgi:hypothetical protein